MVYKLHINKAVKKVGLDPYFLQMWEKEEWILEFYRHSKKEVAFFGDEKEIEGSGEK